MILLNLRRKTISLILLFLALNGFAHGNHHHNEEVVQKKPDEAKALKDKLLEINVSYKRDIRQIFQRSCYDCHSQSSYLPWYSSLPLVSALLEHDITDAREHLDFTHDFPFQGHGNPVEDLQAIVDVITRKSMPLLRYRIMHWDAALTEDESKTILKWASESKKLLGSEIPEH